jgi:hypothetical protein
MRNASALGMALGLCLVFATSAEPRAEQPALLDPTLVAPTPPADPQPACLNERDVRRLVQAGTVVAPIAAIRAARAAVAGEAVGARLCREGDGHMYRVTLLTEDGTIIRVSVNGRTGRVADRR